MKNRFLERSRQQARHYHSTQAGGSWPNGVCIYHVYDDEQRNELSWWDDVGFIHSRMRVKVAWQHPRNLYQAYIDTAAYTACAHLNLEPTDWFSQPGKTLYKKVGLGRKKRYATEMLFTEAQEAWLQALAAAKEELRFSAQYTIYPSIRIRQLPWCKAVELVAPLEVRSQTEAHQLINVVRALLKQETTLNELFPGCHYTQANWLAEQGSHATTSESQFDTPISVPTHLTGEQN